MSAIRYGQGQDKKETIENSTCDIAAVMTLPCDDTISFDKSPMLKEADVPRVWISASTKVVMNASITPARVTTTISVALFALLIVKAPTTKNVTRPHIATITVLLRGKPSFSGSRASPTCLQPSSQARTLEVRRSLQACSNAEALALRARYDMIALEASSEVTFKNMCPVIYELLLHQMQRIPPYLCILDIYALRH